MNISFSLSTVVTAPWLIGWHSLRLLTLINFTEYQFSFLKNCQRSSCMFQASYTHIRTIPWLNFFTHFPLFPSTIGLQNWYIITSNDA